MGAASNRRAFMKRWLWISFALGAQGAQNPPPVTVGDVMLANDTRDPVLQGQAMERVFQAGRAAIPAVLEFIEKKGNNALTLVFTQRLSSLADPRVEDLLARLFEDRRFYWRPAATWGLAELAPARYLHLFRRALDDHLWAVRQAGLLGLDVLLDRESIPKIRELLGDEFFPVRAQAARTLAALGDESGLPVLVAALRDTTQWFDIDYGQLAREDAFNFLRRHTGLDFGFRAWEASDKREASVRAWEAWAEKRWPDWKERVPKTAWPKADKSRYVFGLELRSCQLGDFFFRIDDADTIVLGSFNLERSKLSPNEVRRIREAIGELDDVDPYQTYGRSGCDFEKYYVLAEDGHTDTPCFYVGGRPKNFDKMVALFAEVLGTHFGEAARAAYEKRSALFRE